MTLQEKQQKEIKMLSREINEMYEDPKKLCHGDLIGLYNSLEQVTADPETKSREGVPVSSDTQVEGGLLRPIS